MTHQTKPEIDLEKIAFAAACKAFERLFGAGADFSVGMLAEKPHRNGSMTTSWDSSHGKRYARTFLTVSADGTIPFAPIADYEVQS